MLSEKPEGAGLECGAESLVPCPSTPTVAGGLSFEGVQAELIEAVKLSWRMPGEGRGSAFATDAPWFLLTAKARASAAVAGRIGSFAEWEAARQEIERQAVKDMRNSPRTSPLTAREVDWMNERLGWLELVPERDRRLVAVAVGHIAAAGDRRVSWRRIRAALNRNRHWRAVAISDRGLGMRYSRALSGLVRVLQASANSQPSTPAA